MSQNIFTYPIKVAEEHIDSLNHVNNEVYIKWLLEVAMAHSSSLGYTMEKFLSDGSCFVVRRHEIDYLAPAFINEDLIVETWLKEVRGTRTSRVYAIRRASDQKILIKAETLWVYINLQTGKPTEIPEELAEAFAAFVH